MISLKYTFKSYRFYYFPYYCTKNSYIIHRLSLFLYTCCRQGRMFYLQISGRSINFQGSIKLSFCFSHKELLQRHSSSILRQFFRKIASYCLYPTYINMYTKNRRLLCCQVSRNVISNACHKNSNCYSSFVILCSYDYV